jgi:adenosylcobinamide-phosphate synthase
VRRALLAAVVLDAVLADPARWHPVAGYGRAAAALERRLWRDSRAAGTAYVLVAVGVPVLSALPARRSRLAFAVGLWACLGGTSLGRVAAGLGADLERGDLAAARTGLPALCGRDAAALDAAGLARAVVESVAENTSDAAVAPLLWAAAFGLPGVVGYRAANTLDAMVGHRSARYMRFGTAAARLDDAANLLPARVTAALTCLLAPLVGGSPRAAWRGWRTAGHPSPNAGPCEGSFAGALGRTLGGALAYDGRAEQRPTLGAGPAPGAADIARAVRLSRAVVLAAVLLLAVRR